MACLYPPHFLPLGYACSSLPISSVLPCLPPLVFHALTKVFPPLSSFASSSFSFHSLHIYLDRPSSPHSFFSFLFPIPKSWFWRWWHKGIVCYPSYHKSDLLILYHAVSPLTCPHQQRHSKLYSLLLLPTSSLQKTASWFRDLEMGSEREAVSAIGIN